MSRLIHVGNCISVLFFYLVCIVALKSMISESYLAAIVLLPALVGFGKLYRKYKKTDMDLRLDEEIKKYRVLIWCCLQTLSIIVMVIMTVNLRVKFSWDWGKLISTAVSKVVTGEWSAMEYYSRYPNNQAWLLCLTAYFKFIRLMIPVATEKTFYVAAILVSIAFTQITLWLVYQTARILFSEKRALLVGMIGLICLPFYLYAQFAYTDTISMMMVIFAAYIYLKLKSSKGNGNCIGLGFLLVVTSVLIFNIKILGFIAIIAMVLDSILNCDNYRKLIFILISCFVLWGAGTKISVMVIENKLPMTDEMADRYEFSWTHWVMMGMNKKGGYSEDDVAFSKSVVSFEERQEAEISELKRRITGYGVKGTLNHLFNTKLSRTWGKSCLAGDDYIHRKPYSENSLWQRLFGVGEDLHWIVLTYSWIFHILMILGMFLEGIYSLKEDAGSRKFMMLRYTVLGVGIFLTLWECNSRYLLPFLPVMILLSSRGWELVIYKCSVWRLYE
ncbi:MAG: glycosyltransferase family 39 protein [Lachnospiraceae bacterium]|nr:glycosyltransferase family 39 protein [Lachnospiraceae bacterium]